MADRHPIRVLTEKRNPSRNSATIRVEGPWLFDSAKCIDWNNSSDRKWLTNHMHWALHNDRQVRLYSESN